MSGQRIKRFLPRGLYGRALLILVVPVVTILLVVSVVFIQRQYERVTEQMTAAVVREVALIERQIAAAPDLATAQAVATGLGAPLGLAVRLPGAPPGADRRGPLDLSGRAVIATLRAGLPGLGAVDLQDDGRTVRFGLATRFGPAAIEVERRQFTATNPHQFLVLMIFTGVVMTLVAYAFLRNQVRPIAQLAAAADAFGRGRSVPYRPRGATEVRAAGRAFLDMRARIERHLEQRTLMLSGVSHDLRTPLTRLRLSLSLIEDGPEAEAMRADIDEMARMLDGFLAFARGEADEVPEAVDAAALVRGAVLDAARGGLAVELAEVAGPPGPVMLRPQTVRRALANLIGNGARHGSRVEVSLRAGPSALRLVVEDDGPGIPEPLREAALRPFVRLDDARNQDRGAGVGLGLAICADIARAHGGSLGLGHSARLGGLRAEIVLPIRAHALGGGSDGEGGTSIWSKVKRKRAGRGLAGPRDLA